MKRERDRGEGKCEKRHFSKEEKVKREKGEKGKNKRKNKKCKYKSGRKKIDVQWIKIRDNEIFNSKEGKEDVMRKKKRILINPLCRVYCFVVFVFVFCLD